MVWSGYGKLPTGPISSKTQVLLRRRDEVRLRPGQGEGADQGIRLQGRDDQAPGAALWRDLDAAGREAIKQNFEEVGVKVEIVSTDVPGWTQKRLELRLRPDLQLPLPARRSGDRAWRAPTSRRNIVKGNPFGNVGGYSNPEVDRLFAEAAIAPAEKRQELYTKVQKILAEELPVLWLLEIDFPTIYRCNVKNLITTGIGVNDGVRERLEGVSGSPSPSSSDGARSASSRGPRGRGAFPANARSGRGPRSARSAAMTG